MYKLMKRLILMLEFEDDVDQINLCRAMQPEIKRLSSFRNSKLNVLLECMCCYPQVVCRHVLIRLQRIYRHRSFRRSFQLYLSCKNYQENRLVECLRLFVHAWAHRKQLFVENFVWVHHTNVRHRFQPNRKKRKKSLCYRKSRIIHTEK